MLLTQPDDILVGAYERLQRTKSDYIADCLVELREGSAILREKFGEVTETEKKSAEGSDAQGAASAANAGAGESGLRFGLFTPTELPTLPWENPFADAERFAASPVSQWVSMVAEQKALPDQSPSRETNQPQLDLSKLFPYTEEDIKALYDDFAQIIEDNKNAHL